MATKVTVNKAPTPSQEVIAAAAQLVEETDARGRVISVRRITMNIRRRVLKALSAESAAKDRYLGLVMLAASCTAIDGDPVNLPTTELQFDHLIDRLDDDGFEAIGKAIKENFGTASAEEVVDEAKN